MERGGREGEREGRGRGSVKVGHTFVFENNEGREGEREKGREVGEGHQRTYVRKQ